MVYGDRRKYLTALITLNPETITTYAAKEKIKTNDLATLAKKHQIHMLIEEEISKKNRELASYERIKKFSILPRDFSIENGELTPTLKVKRREVTQKYQELLDGMYEKEFASIILENK